MVIVGKGVLSLLPRQSGCAQGGEQDAQCCPVYHPVQSAEIDEG